MDTPTNTGGNGATTGAAVAHNAGPAVATPAVNGDQRRSAVAPAAPWCRVSDLARELRRDARRLRELVAAEVSETDQRRVPRATGGQAELWVSPAAADLLRARFGPAGATPAATPASNGANTGAAGATAGATPAATPSAVGCAVDLAPPVSPTGEADRDAGEGWRELTAELRAEADRLRSERDQAREEAAQERRRADEAERARSVYAERLADLRAAWWRWYAVAQARPWWRRRLPALPAELASDKRLAKPSE